VLYYENKNGVSKIGCVKVLDTWEGINELLHSSNGIDGKNIGADYCSSIDSGAGFVIDVEVSFTNRSLTGLFTCRAESIDFGEISSLEVDVKKIKGKHAGTKICF